jgi:hypothetical protein
LPALRDPSEVRLWLQRQPFLPLDPREKQFLEDEVEAAAVAASLAAENGGGDSSRLNANIGGLEPTGSTDLDHIIGGGGGRSSNTTASKNNRNATTNSNTAAGGGALDTGRKRNDYSSMHLPSDHISPMKKSPNQNTKNNNTSAKRYGGANGGDATTSPSVAIATTDQQNNPYLMSFSPVPSNLPFGTLAEYENEHGHHQQQQQASSSISSPVHPSTLSPRPSGDLHSEFSSRNSNTATTTSTTTSKQQQGEKNGNDDVAIDLDWLGKVQQTAFEVAGSVYSRINELIVAGKDTSGGILNNKPGNYPKRASEQPSNGGGNVEGSMVTLATVAGASIFAYAMYTERVLIKNSAKRAWRGVEDLVKIAFLFTPNPMA